LKDSIIVRGMSDMPFWLSLIEEMH